MRRRVQKVNPLVHKVALNNLRQRVVDMRIQMLMMDDGEYCATHVLLLNQQLTVLSLALEARQMQDSEPYQALAAAHGVFRACAECGFKWNKADAMVVDQALGVFLEWTGKLPVAELVEATQKMLAAST